MDEDGAIVSLLDPWTVGTNVSVGVVFVVGNDGSFPIGDKVGTIVECITVVGGAVVSTNRSPPFPLLSLSLGDDPRGDCVGIPSANAEEDRTSSFALLFRCWRDPSPNTVKNPSAVPSTKRNKNVILRRVWIPAAILPEAGDRTLFDEEAGSRSLFASDPLLSSSTVRLCGSCPSSSSKTDLCDSEAS